MTQDKSFKKYAQAYANDEALFFKECVLGFYPPFFPLDMRITAPPFVIASPPPPPSCSSSGSPLSSGRPPNLGSCKASTSKKKARSKSLVVGWPCLEMMDLSFSLSLSPISPLSAESARNRVWFCLVCHLLNFFLAFGREDFIAWMACIFCFECNTNR